MDLAQIELLKETLKVFPIDKRVYALFSLSTMARVSAVANLKWEEIDLDRRICENITEKGGKIVTLFFSEEVRDCLLELQAYRLNNNIDDYGYLFPSPINQDMPISVSLLCDWAHEIGRAINIPTLHPHDFRHSGAQQLRLRGCPIETISELLNHDSVDTTKKYYLKQDKVQLQQLKDSFEQ